MSDKVMSEIDLEYRAEEVAKIRHETGLTNLWDIGLDDQFRQAFGLVDRASAADFVHKIILASNDGFTLLGCNGIRIYVLKHEKEKRIDISLRKGAVLLMGEEAVAKIEQQITAKKSQ